MKDELTRIFGQKVLEILDNCCDLDWDRKTVLEIAKVASGIGLATIADNGEFELI